MNRLRGVAVGAGYFSQFHLDAWSRMECVQLVGICDTDTDKAESVRKRFNIANAYTDFQQMLDGEQPDFVDIITRPDTHLELTKQAVNSGIPVICQKPLAPSFAEAKQLVKTASDAGVPLMVHENFRFQPWYREIRAILDAGTIGDKLHTINIRTRTGDGWQSDAYLSRQPYFRQMERFLVFEMGVHFIDTMRYLGGEIDGVYACLRQLNKDIAGEDCGTILFEFANSALGVWDANRFNDTNSTEPRYTFADVLVEADKGAVRLYGDGRLTLQPIGGKEVDHEYDHQQVNFAGDCVLATQQHFVDQLQNQSSFETSGTEYLKTLAIQEATYESAASQLPVRGLARARGPVS